MGMEDKRLSHHYPYHTDMITYSLSAHKDSILHFLQKLKKNNQGMWALGAVQVLDMCNVHVQKR